MQMQFKMGIIRVIAPLVIAALVFGMMPFTVFATSNDAGITGITVKDIAATGTGTAYSVVLPYGTVADLGALAASDIVAVPSDSKASVAVTGSAGSWSVIVTAEDTTTEAYTITVTLAAASNNTGITGITVKGIAAAAAGTGTAFSVVLPYGTVADLGALAAGDIIAAPADSKAFVAVTGSAGSWSVVVTAEDAVTTATYTVTVTLAPAPTAVSWTGLTANGTSNSTNTTLLTLTFSVNPTTLTASDITVTGATKGTLTGTGLTRTLAISNITVKNGADVTVALANPAGYAITPSAKTVAVNVAPLKAVNWSALRANGSNNLTTTTLLTLTFSVNPTTLTASDITVTGATKGTLTGTGLTRTLAISKITVKNGARVTVEIANQPADFTISPDSRTVVVYVAKSSTTDSGTTRDGSTTTATTTTTTTTTTAVSNTPVDVTSAAAENAAKAAVKAAQDSGASTATAHLKNPGNISAEALKAMAGATGLSLKLNANSMSEDGKSIDVRITLYPSKEKAGVNLSASTANKDAKAIRARFEKYFNNKVSVVSLGQKGSFSQPVEIAVKLDSKLNAGTLVFYSYNKATNVYNAITAPSYKVDKNGYVHFTTALAGDIIVADKPLALKK